MQPLPITESRDTRETAIELLIPTNQQIRNGTFIVVGSIVKVKLVKRLIFGLVQKYVIYFKPMIS